MEYNLKQLRKDAAMRALDNDLMRMVDEQTAIIRRAIREQNRISGAAIDSAMRTPKNKHEHATTRQLQQDRFSIHDHAANNPLLRKILRDMSK